MSSHAQDDQYNMGYLCTRKQCEIGNADKIAMRFITPSLERHDYTFRDMDLQSNRFANVLRKLGFAKGDAFFTFYRKHPRSSSRFWRTKTSVRSNTLFTRRGTS
jgi:acetyl-CoA synthetase